MAEPWAVRESSDQGDENEEVLFAAIGRAISKWEELEEDLADLFSLLVGSKELVHDPSNPASRVYGKVPNFSALAEMLDAAAEAFFENNYAPALAKEFKDVLKSCRGFAARRNEIAAIVTNED